MIQSIESGEVEEESRETEVVELEDVRRLGIATLGSLKQHPRISAFRRFVEGWYLSYFAPDAARSLPLAGPQAHLNIHGDNLGNFVQFMQREHSKRFQTVLKRIAEKIPGIDKIDTEKTNDGRLLLRFNDEGFRDPFYSQQMSDGTLKVFAYSLPPISPILSMLWTPLKFEFWRKVRMDFQPLYKPIRSSSFEIWWTKVNLLAHSGTATISMRGKGCISRSSSKVKPT